LCLKQVKLRISRIFQETLIIAKHAVTRILIRVYYTHDCLKHYFEQSVYVYKDKKGFRVKVMAEVHVHVRTVKYGDGVLKLYVKFPNDPLSLSVAATSPISSPCEV